MEAPILFNNVGKPWSKTEDAQLNKLYNEDMLNVIEISKIHNRAPGGIISRLNKQGYIEDRKQARGYVEYTNSDLYKEILKNNKDKKKNEIVDKKEKLCKTSQLDSSSIHICKHDYLELKNDVKDMKNEIVHLIEMMKSVYEFEDA
jgi:hypothetical protein